MEEKNYHLKFYGSIYVLRSVCVCVCVSITNEFVALMTSFSANK